VPTVRSIGETSRGGRVIGIGEEFIESPTNRSRTSQRLDLILYQDVHVAIALALFRGADTTVSRDAENDHSLVIINPFKPENPLNNI
jgi:hypothetical protein